MSYHKFKSSNLDEYGSFEVFALDGSINDDIKGSEGEPLEAGWYWWACFPGCMPDSDYPTGPFATEEAAISNAREEEY